MRHFLLGEVVSDLVPSFSPALSLAPRPPPLPLAQSFAPPLPLPLHVAHYVPHLPIFFINKQYHNYKPIYIKHTISGVGTGGDCKSFPMNQIPVPYHLALCSKF